MFSKIGLPELLIILAIAILIFGAKELPKLGKATGETIKNFKIGIRESKKDINEAAGTEGNDEE